MFCFLTLRILLIGLWGSWHGSFHFSSAAPPSVLPMVPCLLLGGEFKKKKGNNFCDWSSEIQMDLQVSSILYFCLILVEEKWPLCNTNRCVELCLVAITARCRQCWTFPGVLRTKGFWLIRVTSHVNRWTQNGFQNNKAFLSRRFVLEVPIFCNSL